MSNEIIRRLLLTVLLLSGCYTARSQVLISLIFGDKLNSDKLEFGLSRRFNASNLSNVAGNPDTKSLPGFHLGFYFDIKLQESLFIDTGVLVKSPMGDSSIAPYPVGDADLNSCGKGKFRIEFNPQLLTLCICHSSGRPRKS